MKVVMDAFGGDNAPLAVLEGAAAALRENPGLEIVLTGSEEEIRRCAAEHGIDLSGIGIADAPLVMEMHDEAKSVIRAKRNSSMGKGLDLVADGEADVFISAGPTGALLMGATMIVKRIKHVDRPALGTVLPGMDGYTMIIDCGANAECRPEMLRQFGVMGSIYMERVLGIKDPRVAIANIGAEDTKGTDLQKDAYALLKEDPRVNFIGNVEGRGLMMSECDVAVCDGFTGNMCLKSIEGTAIAMSKMLKGMFYKNAKTKIAGLLVKSEMGDFKKKLDYSEVGGAPFIGLRGPVIKAHGSSDAKAFKNAVKQAVSWVGADVTAAITEAFAAGEETKDE